MKLIAVYYISLLPIIEAVAKGCGYAIAMHGSLSRDFDLVAVPWVEGATTAQELAECIRKSVNGQIKNDPDADPHDETKHNPVKRPHGRLSWTIYIGATAYIDLSVMPRLLLTVTHEQSP